MYIGPLALAFVIYVHILKAILYRFEYTTPVLSLWYSRCSVTQRHRAILHLFEYTTPVLSLWYSRCSDMQRHRAILHLFEYTTPVLSLWYILCSNTQWHSRYCTFLNRQQQFVLVIYQMQHATFQIFNAGFSFKRGIRFTNGGFTISNWGLNYFKLVFENSIAFFWPFAH